MSSVRLSATECSERAAKAKVPFPELNASFVSSHASVDAATAEKFTVWRIPKITPEGTCSRPGDLDPEPFNLLASVYARSADSSAAGGSGSGLASPSASADSVVARAAVLHEVVRLIEEATGADWVGVYRTIESPPAAAPRTAGERCLVKEAYRGAPSRPFFPLTPEFAAHSNNSTVAMTAQAILLPDTRKLGDEDPYYVCDAKVSRGSCRRRPETTVQLVAHLCTACVSCSVSFTPDSSFTSPLPPLQVRSELCAPIIGSGGAVIGIIDAESFKPHHFTGSPEAEERTNYILAACARLGEVDLLTHMLA